jgi:Ca-activated chloride channel family protein
MRRFGNNLLPLLVPAFAVLQLQSTVEVDVNLINIFLTVHDPQGRYVSGLGPDDFAVFEDGELQAIEVFETADGVRSSLGLLLDNSGSSADILDSIRSGVVDFARGLEPEDEIFVMSFGTNDRVVHDFSDSRTRLRASLAQLESWGTSVFFDALASGIDKVARGVNPRKALIVLTDGQDNGSRTSYLEVVHAAESHLVMLYFIGMGAPILVDTHTLEGLAALTGGRVVQMGRDESPRDALAEIRDELSEQYFLAYYSAAREGSHNIRVEVPGAEVTIRSREGFIVEPE